jgi:GNAT superfamily N-acetyltransferase
VSSKVRFHVEGIAVDDKYRGLGIGKKLIKFVEDIAILHAPCVIDLVSGVRRAKDGTHEFYKALGYLNDGEMAKLYLRKEL